VSPLVLEVAQNILQEGYGVLLKTRGDSMVPIIRSGGLIQVDPVRPDDLVLRDIVVYRQGDRVVAHRLVAKHQREGNLLLFTRGDAFSWQYREEISPEQVLGRVLAATWPLSQGIFLILVKLKTGWARLGRRGPDISGSGKPCL
jgi:signal peptidase I